LEYTHSVRYSELSLISAFLVMINCWCQVNYVVGIKHNKLQLDVLGCEGLPGAIPLQFMNVSSELYVVHYSVVLWVDTCPLAALFVVSHVLHSNDASLLEGPLSQLLAEDVVR